MQAGTMPDTRTVPPQRDGLVLRPAFSVDRSIGSHGMALAAPSVSSRLTFADPRSERHDEHHYALTRHPTSTTPPPVIMESDSTDPYGAVRSAEKHVAYTGNLSLVLTVLPHVEQC